MTLRSVTARLVAALTLASAATIGVVSQPAQGAAAPTHVAIVVANVGSACVPWHSGLTGADVLNANFNVTWGGPPSYVGFVLKINGTGTSQPTTKKYWAYYHNSGGGWVYSGSGATGYQPQPGTVEGWAFDDGQQSAPTPPSTSYAAICGGQDPAPAPTPPHPVTHAPSTHRATSPPAAQPGHPTSPTSATGGGAHSSASTRAAGSHATSSTKRQSSSAGTTSSSPGTQPSASSSSSEANQPAVQLVGAKQGGKHSSVAPAVGTVLGLLAVAGLGGAAFWRLRRQKLG